MLRESKGFIQLQFILISLVLILGAGAIFFVKSQMLIGQADKLIKSGKAKDAISLYTQAKILFPLRWDLKSKIDGANLVLQSELEYQKISEVDAEIENAEVQNIPSIETLPPKRQLKPNEVLVPILMYHHIEGNPRPRDRIWASLFVTPTQLDAQLNYLATHNYHAITLSDLYQALNGSITLPSNPVVLTFDDGYKSFYTNALPLLKKYQFKAIEFVITGVTTLPAYLSWDQIKELDATGLIEIGAHTKTHPSLSALSQKAVINEVRGSKADIEAHIKSSVNWFAYPYGNYNNSVVSAVKDAGYLGAVSIIYGSVESLDKIYYLPRVMVDGRFSLDEFAKRLY